MAFYAFSCSVKWINRFGYSLALYQNSCMRNPQVFQCFVVDSRNVVEYLLCSVRLHFWREETLEEQAKENAGQSCSVLQTPARGTDLVGHKEVTVNWPLLIQESCNPSDFMVLEKQLWRGSAPFLVLCLSVTFLQSHKMTGQELKEKWIIFPFLLTC